MKTKTTSKQTKNLLIRKFHTLASKAGLTADDKTELVRSYGVFSSSDMEENELTDACKLLSDILKKSNGEMDKHRKRVIAAIDGYLRITNSERNIDIIKGIATRATGFRSFNEIPKERLINIYYAFVNKQKDIKSTNGFVVDDLLTKSILN